MLQADVGVADPKNYLYIESTVEVALSVRLSFHLTVRSYKNLEFKA